MIKPKNPSFKDCIKWKGKYYLPGTIFKIDNEYAMNNKIIRPKDEILSSWAYSDTTCKEGEWDYGSRMIKITYLEYLGRKFFPDKAEWRYYFSSRNSKFINIKDYYYIPKDIYSDLWWKFKWNKYAYEKELFEHIELFQPMPEEIFNLNDPKRQRCENTEFWIDGDIHTDYFISGVLLDKEYHEYNYPMVRGDQVPIVMVGWIIYIFLILLARFFNDAYKLQIMWTVVWIVVRAYFIMLASGRRSL